MNPSSKNKVVLYPRFTKLIIYHTLAKFLDIPRCSNEPHQIVEDDRVVGFMVDSGNVEAKGESSAPLPIPMLKFKIQAPQQDPIIPTLTYKEIDIDRLTKVQQVTYDVAKSVREAEKKETLKKVDTMVDEVDEEEFFDSLIATQEDLGTRIETWSHKESPEEESE
ncbi:hypothetical protein Tco_1143567 [Tanacetum coccineum]